MARRFQRSEISVARNKTTSQIATRINSALGVVAGGINQDIRQLERDESDANREAELVERQGFDERRRVFVEENTKEDGSFDFNAARKSAESGFGALTPHNESIMLSGVLSDISKLQQNEDDVKVENDVLIAGRTARGLDAAIEEAMRVPFGELAATDSSEGVDLDALRQPFVDEFAAQHPGVSSEGMAEFEAVIASRTTEAFDKFSAVRNAARRENAFDAQVGDTLSFARTPDATIGSFTERFKAGADVLRGQGFTKSEVQDFNQVMFTAIIGQARDDRRTDHLDKLASINAALPELLRVPQKSLQLAVTNARTAINLEVTSALTKTLSGDIGQAGTVFELRRLQGEIGQVSEFSDEVREGLNRQIEKQSEIVNDRKRNDILNPVKESAAQSVTASDFAVDESRLNSLADMEVVGLDGKPMKLFPNEMLEPEFKKLRNAKASAGVKLTEESQAADILRSGASWSSLDLSTGSNASNIINADFDRQVDDQAINPATQYLANLDNRGAVTEHMTERLASSLFPVVGPAGQGLDEAEAGLADLARISARYPGHASQIAAMTTSGRLLMTLDRNGFGRRDILQLISSKSPGDVEEALAVSSFLPETFDRTPLGDVANPSEAELFRYSYAQNLLRMRPNAIAGEASDFDRNKDGLIWTIDQNTQAAQSALRDTRERMSSVSVYGRTISLPRNVVNNSGDQVRDAFKIDNGEVLTQQTQKVVSAAGLGEDFDQFLTFTFGDNFLDEAFTDSGRLELFQDDASGRSYWRMPVVQQTEDRGDVDLGWVEVPTSEARQKELLKP